MSQPTWPASVKVYTTNTPISQILADTNSAFTQNGGQNPPDNGQFNGKGVAFLFAPGVYNIPAATPINIGYYTSIIGLGSTLTPGSPTTTQINNVNSPQGNNCPTIGALNSFWRSAENFYTVPTAAWSGTSKIGMTWAASQASPLRRIWINGNIYLFQLSTPNFTSGYSSGGFMADCTVTSTDPTSSAITAGSQQQFFTRNTDMTSWSNGVWNQVFVGCKGAPASNCGNCTTGLPPCQTCTNYAGTCSPCEPCPLPGAPNCSCNNTPCSGAEVTLGCAPCIECTNLCKGNPYTTLAATPIIAEKPYITSDSTGTVFTLMIPQRETDKVGTSQDNNLPPIPVLFENNVYIANPINDTADTINAQISANKHIILTPGVYHLTKSIVVNTAHTVVLGIGFPILVSEAGLPCIVVTADDVRVGGVLLQAGPMNSPTLLQWGTVGDSIQTGYLYDCFARVGIFDCTTTASQTSTMVQINSSNIICDNLWLWRADHDCLGTVFAEKNPCNIGLDVEGDNVIGYGIASEHTLQNLVQWNGNGGSCYFFQGEYPYDAPADFNNAAYQVNGSNHKAYGVGVYSFFRDNDITVTSGISAPSSASFTNALTRFLNGNGGIKSVLNSTDGTPPVNFITPGPSYLCDYP